jgi:FtsZ-binding cell division protein ZapB
MDLLLDQEVEPLARLEERIRQAAELVAKLRREKEAAVADLEAAQREAAEAGARATKLSREMDTLRGERTEVRGRIEKLLGQMDLLNAG